MLIPILSAIYCLIVKNLWQGSRFLLIFLIIFTHCIISISDNVWQCLTILSNLSKSLAISDYLCQSLTISGNFSQSLTIYGKLGQSWAISGYIWLSLAISGYLWLSLAISSYLWLSLAISSYLYQVFSIRVQVEGGESKLLQFETWAIPRGARPPRKGVESLQSYLAVIGYNLVVLWYFTTWKEGKKTHRYTNILPFTDTIVLVYSGAVEGDGGAKNIVIIIKGSP